MVLMSLKKKFQKMNFTKKFLDETIKAINKIDKIKIEKIAYALKKTRSLKGRVFLLGVGGSSANASHATNDFRKLCNLECYCITDNISEITARTNDEGWENSFINYLKVNNLSKNDVLLVFSVGGGNQKRKVSVNIVRAIKYAKSKNMKVISFLGRADGYAAKNSTIALIFNVENKKFTTPISESLQSFVWHYLVSSPLLKKNRTKW